MRGVEVELIFGRLRKLAKKYLPTALTAALIVALIAYTLYSSLDLSTVRAVTTPAVRSTEYEIAGLDGYLFRDEQVLYSGNSGAAVYRVGDGEKISVSTELARVYNYGSTGEYLVRRRDLESGIDLLRKSVMAGRLSASGIAATRETVGRTYEEIMASLAFGDIGGALAMSDNLIVGLNAHDLITGKNQSLADELSAERAKLAALENSYSGAYESITNSLSGYFFYDCDGYEDVFKYDRLENLDAARLSSLAAEPANLVEGKYAIGKMVYNYVWYLAVPADAYLCDALADDSGCSVKFPSSGLELWLTLDRISPANDKGQGLLIFSCGIMPEGFDYERIQRVELLVSEVSGYRVPDTAVHEVKGVGGVYILSSSVVKFRRINILFEGEGYYVVAERDPEAENREEYLDKNDEIIISLSDGRLYDGRILN